MSMTMISTTKKGMTLMKTEFDIPQKQAIDSRKGNFLVSAGAGSGKTAVLTERIKEIVTDKSAKLDQLLVLTFTNKAAAEMKNRTREKLPELSSQVECADITTFDAFFLKLVKKYASKLKIDPDVTIADSSFLEVRKKELIEEALAKRYENMDENFAEMVKSYTLKSDEKLSDYIERILTLVDLAPDPESCFEELGEQLFDSKFLEKSQEEYYERCDLDIRSAMYLLSESSDEVVQKSYEYLKTWANCGNYTKLYERLTAADAPKSFPRKPNGYEFDDSDKLHLDAAKAIMKKVVEGLKANGDPKSQNDYIISTKKYAAILIEIAKEVHAGLSDYKKEKNAYSFSDIAALARDLLKDETVLSEIKNKYEYIMVDEYQDTSDLQEYFINKIARDNVFMVGDIKQSIYRFRHANPDNFRNKLSAYDRGQGGQAIYLKKNFRSRLEVIDCINSLFGRIMSKEMGEVDYHDNHDLEFGNVKLYGDKPKKDFKATILSYELDPKSSKAELEARAVANDIIAKVQSGLMIDVKRIGQRKCDWGDFAILMPTKDHFNVYKKVFGEAKIPLVATVGNELQDDDINMVFMRLLKLPLVIGEDEVATKHCYASVKRSYLFEEEDEDLFEELQNGSYTQDSLIKEMSSEKERLLSMSVYEAVSYLLDKYGFVEKLKRVGNVKANFKTITSFLSQALNAERMGLDYEGYVEHFEKLGKFAIGQEIKGDFAGDNAVKLMTIHASKGLEFPFVYCPNIVRAFNNRDASGNYIVSKDFGILLPKNRTDDYSKNFVYELFKQKETSKGLSEYMRLFYVQLTRATSKIIFISPKGSGDSYESIDIPTVNRTILTKTAPNSKGEMETKIVSPKTFNDFLNYAGKDFLKKNFEQETAVTSDPTQLAKAQKMEVFKTPSLRSIDRPVEEFEENRASKTSLTPINEAAAQYGSHMHRLLQLVSFKDKDASFIQDAKEKTKVDALFKHPIFENLEGYKEFHEYAFIDDVNNVRGSIDLLLVKAGEKAIIVDYKTKSLDDEAYERQLKLYKQYVERVFKLKAETYLLSISDNVLKVVE